MDKLIVTTIGILSIISIYWFFFGKKVERSGIPLSGKKGADDSITIRVEGGYSPSRLRIQKGKKTTLIFIRKDANSCLEELVLPDFKIKKYLPMHTPVSIVLSPERSGRFDFHCGMNMFHGSIEVLS